MERGKYFNYGTRPASTRTRIKRERERERTRKTGGREKERRTGLLSTDKEKETKRSDQRRINADHVASHGIRSPWFSWTKDKLILSR